MAALDGQPFPPNSLEGIEACLRANAQFIEVDINALAESDYLLVHDDGLEQETSGRGKVAACSLREAHGLKIRHGGKITPFNVPLLSEVVDLFQKYPGTTRLQLDFKNLVPFASDEPLNRLVGLIEPLEERVLVSTGADWQLRKLRRTAPGLLLGFDIMLYIGWEPAGATRDPREFPKQRGAYGYFDDHILATQAAMKTADYLRDRCESLVRQVPDVAVFYLDHRLIAQSLADGFSWAEALHEEGIRLDAWTMDATNPDAMRNALPLRDAGVDLFTSNTPRAWAKLLEENQERPSK